MSEANVEIVSETSTTPTTKTIKGNTPTEDAKPKFIPGDYDVQGNPNANAVDRAWLKDRDLYIYATKDIKSAMKTGAVVGALVRVRSKKASDAESNKTFVIRLSKEVGENGLYRMVQTKRPTVKAIEAAPAAEM